MIRVGLSGLLSVASCLAQGAFVISGTVVDGLTNDPIPNVRVHLDKSAQRNTPDPLDWVKTGADGRFSFSVREAAMYSISAQYRGMTQRYGQTRSGGGFGVGVLTGPDRDTGHLVFQWFRAAAISGKVTDEDGDPIQSAIVQLLRVSIISGKKTLVAYTRTWSDEHGEYRIGAIPGGSYFVVVTGEFRKDGSLLGVPNDAPARAYVPVYFPEMPSVSAGAKAIQVKASDEIHRNFVLHSIAGVRVVVTFPDMSKRRGVQIVVVPEALESVQSVQTVASVYGVQHTLHAIPPGRYIFRLSLSATNRVVFAEKLATVSGDATMVDLSEPHKASIAGVVGFDGPRPRGTFAINLTHSTNKVLTHVPVQMTESGGAFTVSDLFPGTYRLTPFGAEGFHILAAEAVGAKVDGNRNLEIAEGATVKLSINASGEVGSVHGLAVDASGKPVQGVLVLLFDEKLRNDPARLLAFQTDSDGSFDFRRAPAGKYGIAAVEDVEFEYGDPTKLRALLSMSKRVVVKTGETTMVDRVPLISGIAER